MLDPIAAFIRLQVENETEFADLPNKMQVIGANLIPGQEPEYVICATHIGAVPVGGHNIRVLKCFAINIADYQKMTAAIRPTEPEKSNSDPS